MNRPTKTGIRRYKLESAIPNMRFIDIEASDGGPEAWPIEIGWSWLSQNGDGWDLEQESSLIKPDPEWGPEIWSPYAEAVHGISRASLDDASAAVAIASRVWRALGDPSLTVVSDSPKNDQPWLDRLMSCRGHDRIRIISVWEALNGRAEQENLARMKTWLRENKGPHRAGPDAARLAQSVLECHLAPRLPDQDMRPEL